MNLSGRLAVVQGLSISVYNDELDILHAGFYHPVYRRAAGATYADNLDSGKRFYLGVYLLSHNYERTFLKI